MLRKRLWCLAGCAVSFIVLPCPALADLVILSNGDKVSGTLVEVTPGKVVIDSPLMGTLRLVRADVRSIRFGTPEQIKADIEKENEAVIKEATRKAIAGKAGAKAAMNQANNAAPGAANPLAQAQPQVLQNLDANANQQPNANRHARDPFGHANAMLDQLLGPINPHAAGKPGRNLGKAEPANANEQEEIAAAMKQINGMFPNLAGNQQVQNQVTQLLTGQLGLGDIRNQAAEVSRDLRANKRQLQQMGAWSPIYDTYLGILDEFVGRVDGGEVLE